MGRRRRRDRIPAHSRSMKPCESVGQGRRCVVDIDPTVHSAERSHRLFNVTSFERKVVVGTVDKGTMLVSIRSLHGCCKLSIILAPIGSLARPCLSTDGQPTGNPRIHQERARSRPASVAIHGVPSPEIYQDQIYEDRSIRGPPIIIEKQASMTYPFRPTGGILSGKRIFSWKCDLRFAWRQVAQSQDPLRITDRCAPWGKAEFALRENREGDSHRSFSIMVGRSDDYPCSCSVFGPCPRQVVTLVTDPVHLRGRARPLDTEPDHEVDAAAWQVLRPFRHKANATPAETSKRQAKNRSDRLCSQRGKTASSLRIFSPNNPVS